VARKLRVAMIGHEFMGRAHANAWRQVARFFDVPYEPVLHVVCGRSEARVRAAADRLGFAGVSTDWQEVVARADVDLVDICTPGDSHLPIALGAASAGKAILCEKPLANTLAESEQMLAAVQRAGVIHMLCHNYRRAPAVQLARQYVADGRLGRIHHFRGTYLQDWIVDPAFPLVWRLQKERAGSGALGDIASHSIDLARFLVGEITEVSGLLETFVPERPLEGGSGRGAVTVDDAALALVRFGSGAIGSIEGSRFCPGRKNHNRFELNGSRGILVFDLERLNELEIYEEQGSDSGFRRVLATDARHPFVSAWWPPGHALGWEHTFIHTLADLLHGLSRQQLPTPSFEDGVRIQRVLDAIERSARSRSWQAV
jgi:predicted dehydrogenase